MKWEKPKLARRICDIREQMFEEFGNTNPLNIKHVRGGLVDIEFINQYLKLVYAAEHPEILESNTRASFGRMYEAGLIAGKDFEVLDQSIHLFQSTQTILRLMGNKNPEEETLTPGMKDTIAKAIPSKNYEEIKKTLENSQKKVQNLFDRIIIAVAGKAGET